MKVKTVKVQDGQELLLEYVPDDIPFVQDGQINDRKIYSVDLGNVPDKDKTSVIDNIKKQLTKITTPPSPENDKFWADSGVTSQTITITTLPKGLKVGGNPDLTKVTLKDIRKYVIFDFEIGNPYDRKFYTKNIKFSHMSDLKDDHFLEIHITLKDETTKIIELLEKLELAANSYTYTYITFDDNTKKRITRKCVPTQPVNIISSNLQTTTIELTFLSKP